MADYDTLAFSDFDPVTGRPTINGFVIADPGVNTAEAEPGYVNGSRYTYENGTLPPIAIQTVKDGNTLVIGLFVRGDSSFDDYDCVVVALRPQAGAGNIAARRLDIFPAWGDHPTPDDSGFGFGADDAGHPGSAPNGPGFAIRTDKPPRARQYYRRDTNSGDWTAYSPAQAGNAALYDIKVRSWEPPMAAGSPPEAGWSMEIRLPVNTNGNADWITLQSEFGIYINLIRAGRIPTAGLDSDNQYCTQFRFPEFPAAVPDTRIRGFLDQTVVIEPGWYGRGLLNPTAAQVQGVRFQPGMAIGRRPRGNTTDVPGNQISGSADNDLVALLHNSGPAASVTAEIRMANWGLPGLDSWAKPSGLQNPSPPIALAAGSNATPSSGTTVNRWDAAAVVAAGYAARPHQCIWVQLNGAGTNFTQSSMRRNMDFVNLSTHGETAEISGVGYPKPTGGRSDHDFLLATRCRRIAVRDVAGGRQADPLTLALVTQALLNTPEGQERMKQTTNPKAMMATRASRTAKTEPWFNDYVVYLWITEGYRRTDDTITVAGRTMELLDETPGSFGFIAAHKGVADNLGWELSGTGLSRHAPGLLAIPVPVEGQATIGIKLIAEPDGPRGDFADLPPAPPRKRVEGPSPGGTPGNGTGGIPGIAGSDWRKWPLWVWLILGLLVLILLVLLACCRRGRDDGGGCNCKKC
jgi:hypothetical protein